AGLGVDCVNGITLARDVDNIMDALMSSSGDIYPGDDERLPVDLIVESYIVEQSEGGAVYVGRREHSLVGVPAGAIVVGVIGRDGGLACGWRTRTHEKHDGKRSRRDEGEVFAES